MHPGRVNCSRGRLSPVGEGGETMGGKDVYRRGGQAQRDERTALEGEVGGGEEER